MSHGGSTVAAAVAAANGLTARWAATCGGESVAMAGASAWPLLALLASAASGPGRQELQAAVGMDAGHAGQAARTVLGILAGSPGVRVALGLWNRRELILRDEWLNTLPDRIHGQLTGNPRIDQHGLDTWASERTGGLIPRLPIDVNEGTLLLLAGALTARTTWLDPFDEGTEVVAAGPWSGQVTRSLRRLTHTLDDVRVVDTPGERLTICQVMGDAGIDVLLMLGEEGRSATDVLTSGVDVLAGRSPLAPVSALPGTRPGPGITVGHTYTYEPEDPQLMVMVPPFTVRSDHDLLTSPRVFGLATVTDASRGHFPAISDQPLAVSAAAQSCFVDFQARGFEAAAVTAMATAPGGAPPPAPAYRTKRINVAYDRPFGFLNIHRRTGLILTAGWIAEPSAL